MNKPRPTRMLADVAKTFLADSFAKQGFAAAELVTRWQDIAGPEIAAHSEPIKIQWPRGRVARQCAGKKFREVYDLLTAEIHLVLRTLSGYDPAAFATACAE